MSKGTAGRMMAHLQAVGLPTRIADIPAGADGLGPTAKELIALMAQDKKVRRGKLTFILVRGIGEAFVANAVDPQEIEAFLEARCTR